MPLTQTPSPKSGRPTSPTPKRQSRGRRVIDFIEQNCVLTNGEWIGRPFVLLPWQKRLIMELFEVRADGRRRYRWAYVQVSKKNGKTELAAALALYFLIADGEASPLVVCAAASDEQADLVFGAAKRMCELSPTLSLITERFEKEILVPSIPGAKLKRVAAATGTNDGQNIHAVICDELHEWLGPKGEQVWNVLTNGTGARKQPMVLQITTAGWDKDTICGRQYDLATSIARGEVRDERYYSFIVEAPDAAPIDDPETWRQANPSFGVTIEEDFFRDQLPPRKKESVFRRYFLDQWVQAEDFWLPAGAWDACRDAGRELDRRWPIAVGIDMGLVNDYTAVLVAQLQPDGHVVIRPKFWGNPYPPNHPAHDKWRVDIAAVEQYLLDLRKAYPQPAAVDDRGRRLAGPVYCYDHWMFEESAQRLGDEGLAMVDVPQNPTRLVPAAKKLYDLVISRELHHDGDPIMAEHVRNVVAKPRGERGWWLEKPAGSLTKHIDGVRSLLNAITELPEPVQAKSVGAFLA